MRFLRSIGCFDSQNLTISVSCPGQWQSWGKKASPAQWRGWSKLPRKERWGKSYYDFKVHGTSCTMVSSDFLNFIPISFMFLLILIANGPRVSVWPRASQISRQGQRGHGSPNSNTPYSKQYC